MFEGTGMPRMAGRVVGWLLLCDPQHQTAAQVGRVVGASKGSISSVLRHLVAVDIVERFGVPGERCKFYRMRPGGWVEHMRDRMRFARALRQLADRGLELMHGEEPQLLARLQEFRDLHAFFEKEMPALMDRYEKETSGR